MKKRRIWIEQQPQDSARPTPAAVRSSMSGAPATPLFWNESRRIFVTGEGTNYRSQRAAEDAIVRFKLTHCRVVMN